MAGAGSVNGRVFTPELFLPHELWSAAPPDAVSYDAGDELSRLVVNVGRGPVAIFIDGACRGNGTASARAAFGVYLGESSFYNFYGLLPSSAKHTSQAAEIYAAQQAVNLIKILTAEAGENRFLIITDSDYLFKSITQYIYNWVSNGFLNARGLPVVNGDAFRQLHASIAAFEARAIRIRFWKVDRAYNQAADRLANKALDSPPKPMVQSARYYVAYCM